MAGSNSLTCVCQSTAFKLSANPFIVCSNICPPYSQASLTEPSLCVCETGYYRIGENPINCAE